MGRAFAGDNAGRLADKADTKVTTDGLNWDLGAIGKTFGWDAHFAQVIKTFGNEPGNANPTRRYSPSEVSAVQKIAVSGQPNPEYSHTGHIERSNLTIRMGQRRFTRRTAAFSKKLANHIHSLSIFFSRYNLCRIHKTLRVSPAMEAGVRSRPCTLSDRVRVRSAPKSSRPPNVPLTGSGRAGRRSTVSRWPRCCARLRIGYDGRLLRDATDGPCQPPMDSGVCARDADCERARCRSCRLEWPLPRRALIRAG